MGIRTETREIDGATYSVTTLPAMRALRTLNRIGRSVGPALGKLAGLSGPEVGLDQIGEVAMALFDRLPDDELDGLTRILLDGATRNGRPLLPTIDLDLAGATLTILKILKFAFEVNYGDFTLAARGFGGARAAAVDASRASTT